MIESEIKRLLKSSKVYDLLVSLYGKDSMGEQYIRYVDVIDGFSQSFADTDMFIFSSPGRTEISGNHTDHNHGKVIGASINLDCICAAAKNKSSKINIISKTFNQKFTIDLNKLEPSSEKSGTVDLVKGLMMGFKESGYAVGGFDAYITSNVIPSAGVSSSAAFETLLCQVINTFFNEGRIDTVAYAHIGKYAENHYWDKASGLLDQMCCAVGGLISIDFLKPEEPIVKKIDFDFVKAEHSLIIVQTGKGHADLSAEYSYIPSEMKKVAEFFGKDTLADIDEAQLLEKLSEVRAYAGDRSVMRSIHFFEENKRVEAEIDALRKDDFQSFLSNITASGNSSWKYLQNCYNISNYQEQGISITLALTELFLIDKKCGACRVHGGGFAGVIMVMIPNCLTEEYIEYIEHYIGAGNAYKMSIRPLGSICINDFM